MNVFTVHAGGSSWASCAMYSRILFRRPRCWLCGAGPGSGQNLTNHIRLWRRRAINESVIVEYHRSRNSLLNMDTHCVGITRLSLFLDNGHGRFADACRLDELRRFSWPGSNRLQLRPTSLLSPCSKPSRGAAMGVETTCRSTIGLITNGFGVKAKGPLSVHCLLSM